MKLTVAALTIFAASAASADPIEGVWMTRPDDNGHVGQIVIAPCADRFCGKLVASFDDKGAPFASPNIGKLIIWDMAATGDGSYGGGKVWSPDRDKIYKSKMLLSGDTLAVSGCVFGICRDGGTWTRQK